MAFIWKVFGLEGLFQNRSANGQKILLGPICHGLFQNAVFYMMQFVKWSKNISGIDRLGDNRLVDDYVQRQCISVNYELITCHKDQLNSYIFLFSSTLQHDISIWIQKEGISKLISHFDQGFIYLLVDFSWKA